MAEAISQEYKLCDSHRVLVESQTWWPLPCNPSSLEAEAGRLAEFKDSLGQKVSPPPSPTPPRNNNEYIERLLCPHYSECYPAVIKTGDQETRNPSALSYCH